MNDQELKDLWRKQKTEAPPPGDARVQVEAMRNKMVALRRALKVFDFGELAARGAFLVVFTVYFFTIPHLLTRIGALMLIAGDIYASWKKIQNRRSLRQPMADAPVVEWLKFELATVHQEAELRRTVVVWDTLLFLFGLNAFFWGLPLSFSVKIGPSVLTVVIAASTYWLSQRVRRKQWVPLERELEGLLRLEEGV